MEIRQHPVMVEGSSAAALIACHDCDLLHRRRSLPEGRMARCARCGAVLFRVKRNSLARTLALTLTSLVLFIVTNAYPFMSFEFEGRVQRCTLITGSLELADAGMWSLAALVLLSSVLAPMVEIVGLLYILVPLRMGRTPWKVGLVHRFLTGLGPWGMLEVFMLGVIVAIIKLSEMADIQLGIAFWSFTLLLVSTTAAAATLDARLVWNRLEPRS